MRQLISKTNFRIAMTSVSVSLPDVASATSSHMIFLVGDNKTHPTFLGSAPTQLAAWRKLVALCPSSSNLRTITPYLEHLRTFDAAGEPIWESATETAEQTALFDPARKLTGEDCGTAVISGNVITCAVEDDALRADWANFREMVEDRCGTPNCDFDDFCSGFTQFAIEEVELADNSAKTLYLAIREKASELRWR
jgi:hypothetical protein